jgi:hypothetical protein
MYKPPYCRDNLKSTVTAAKLPVHVNQSRAQERCEVKIMTDDVRVGSLPRRKPTGREHTDQCWPPRGVLCAPEKTP